MKRQHTKLYEEWLAERDLSSPIFIEMEAGKIKVFADPKRESWEGESVRADFYRDKQTELEKAVKDNDENTMKRLLSDLRNTPIFSQDTSNEWRTASIDSPEFSSSQSLARKSLAFYTVRKISLFLDWVGQKQ
jgi:hypothetical protein